MANGSSPQRRRIFREDVKEHLIDAILNGELAAGERIVETQLARELNVSQGPVREALRDLEFLGFVQTQPFRGTYVCRISNEEILQIYPIRAAIEGVAAHAAATKNDPHLLDRLRLYYDQMQEASQTGDRHAQAEANIKFHRAIVEASGNPLLYTIWDSLRLATTTFMSAILTHRPLPELANRHQALLTALELGNPEMAERAARWHIEELRQWILEYEAKNRLQNQEEASLAKVP
jgi:DNA-binding GntR family transcriptional regulator